MVQPTAEATSTRQYAAFLATHRKVVSVGGQPWLVTNRRLMPVAPPHLVNAVSSAEVSAALRQSGALIALWNDTWDTAPCRWWWICCDDREYDLPKFPKNPRRDIRKGLEACEVRVLDPEFFAENAYPVFASAHDRYGIPVPQSAEEFKAGALRNARYAGRQTWGAFVEDKLVAYESCIIVDGAAMSASAKTHPDYLKAHPSNALVYTLTRHYLREMGLKYTSAGERVLQHQTKVQDFQLKMGYRRVYCPLRGAFSPLLSVALAARIHRWGTWFGMGKPGGALERLGAAAAAADIIRHPGLEAESPEPQQEQDDPAGEER